ncbi:hypothetical protein KPATCC21470_1981 [Kitasatospora purpeofusca]
MRGWSHVGGRPAGPPGLLPAHAGLVPAPRHGGPRRLSLPAHAGLVPRSRMPFAFKTSAPRACGVGPEFRILEQNRLNCSPPMRGWSLPQLRAIAVGYPAPRACGVGPDEGSDQLFAGHCSPRMRGWSPPPHETPIPSLLLPAHAGLVPPGRCGGPGSAPAPRACGVGPATSIPGNTGTSCSPRMRGWSHVVGGCGAGPALLPAHAGLVPPPVASRTSADAAPRACGVGPHEALCSALGIDCSPRMRGWSRHLPRRDRRRRLLPAHAELVPHFPNASCPRAAAPRACGVGPWMVFRAGGVGVCSPRMRGWSLDGVQGRGRGGLLPAHAGLVPGWCSGPGAWGSAPRACGVGPAATMWATDSASLLPAHAGLVPGVGSGIGFFLTAPRECGVGPQEGRCRRQGQGCSPRMRGWSRRPRHLPRRRSLLPAHAGLVPGRRRLRRPRRTAPRACGVGPRPSCPSTRAASLLPAHAGLVPVVPGRR